MKKLLFLLLAIAPALPLSAATKIATFEVKGWTCGSCAAATRIAVKKLDGIQGVETDHEKAEITVRYDDSKTAPPKIVQTIEGLGYKARVKTVATSAGSAETRVSTAPTTPERVSFFQVPLGCGAAAGLGCGSASKPILKALQRDPTVAEAKVNYPGTVLAVVWKDPAQAPSGATLVATAFEERHLEATPLRGEAREKALERFESERWYGAADVDRLSEREAQVIASRLVNRARPALGLTSDRLDALTRDLTSVLARHLTRDLDDDCAPDKAAIEAELVAAASRHLNAEQLAELRRAGEQGMQALPGEEK